MNKLEPFADAVVEAYTNGGRTLQQVATVYNCSIGTVRKLLLKRGVARRPVGRKKNTPQETPNGLHEQTL
jgi:transposase